MKKIIVMAFVLAMYSFAFAQDMKGMDMSLKLIKVKRQRRRKHLLGRLGKVVK